MEDSGISPEYRHLYQWIMNRCHGKPKCDASNGTLPDWWQLVDDDNPNCGDGKTLYFTSIHIHAECIGE